MPDWITNALEKYPQGSKQRENFLTSLEQYQTLGRAGYMDLHPEAFRTFAPRYPLSAQRGWEERQQIEDLREMMYQFQGSEAGLIRWLITKKIQDLEYKIARDVGLTEARPPTYKPPPIPDWMKPYIETETITEERTSPGGRKMRGGVTREVGTLRPLGAQEELTSTQQAQMAGYLAWQKAGAPTEYSEWSLRNMSDWQRRWEEYTRQSQALFPKQQSLTTRWRVGEQR